MQVFLRKNNRFAGKKVSFARFASDSRRLAICKFVASGHDSGLTQTDTETARNVPVNIFGTPFVRDIHRATAGCSQ